jgi:hypothetical protein
MWHISKVTLITFVLYAVQIVTAQNADGAVCSIESDCSSGYCYPGPNGQNYCINRDYNCAWPGTRGAVWGEVYYFEGTTTSVAQVVFSLILHHMKTNSN